MLMRSSQGSRCSPEAHALGMSIWAFWGSQNLIEGGFTGRRYPESRGFEGVRKVARDSSVLDGLRERAELVDGEARSDELEQVPLLEEREAGRPFGITGHGQGWPSSHLHE